MKTTRGDHFCYGVFFALSGTSMMQDWYGLEGYMALLRDRWIELPWWVSFAVVLLCTWLHFSGVFKAGDAEK